MGRTKLSHQGKGQCWLKRNPCKVFQLVSDAYILCRCFGLEGNCLRQCVETTSPQGAGEIGRHQKDQFGATSVCACLVCRMEFSLKFSGFSSLLRGLFSCISLHWRAGWHVLTAAALLTSNWSTPMSFDETLSGSGVAALRDARQR